MRLVHFSDVHILESIPLSALPRFGWRRAAAQFELKLLGRARRFRDPLGTLHRIASAIERLEPDHVLFSGDFTALATPREFEEAREALAGLAADPRRFSAVPGNHDRYTAGSVRERRFERFFGDLLASDLPQFQGSTGFPFVHFVGDALAVIGLDTTRLAPLPGLAFGRLDGEQKRHYESILSDVSLRNRAVAVLLHHAPCTRRGGPDTPTHGLRQASDVLRPLAGRPRASVHFGHIHERYWIEASFLQPHLFNAGAATMLPRPGFWVIELDDQGALLSAKEASIDPA